jgi:hypothetical protein
LKHGEGSLSLIPTLLFLLCGLLCSYVVVDIAYIRVVADVDCCALGIMHKV